MRGRRVNPRGSVSGCLVLAGKRDSLAGSMWIKSVWVLDSSCGKGVAPRPGLTR